MRFLVALLFCSSLIAEDIPARAYKYRTEMRHQIRRVWGLDDTPAVMTILAAQIHQESAWRADARSPYAAGLAQFTEDTATWIDSLDQELAAIGNVYSPKWALRAQSIYMKRLWDHFDDSSNDVERWAFALTSYNGGRGWISRERQVARDPTSYFCSTQKTCGLTAPRKRAASSCYENSQYAMRILIARPPIGRGGFRLPLTRLYQGF